MLETKIRELRLARGMDQSQLAALVGVRRETIGRLEKGSRIPPSSWRWISQRYLPFR